MTSSFGPGIGTPSARTTPSPFTRRVVSGAGGLPLAVYERYRPDETADRSNTDNGAAGRLTVLLVHGYPDDHSVWDPVAELLAERFHVVTYDVRGAGVSGVPARTSGYRLDLLAGDAAAVIRATVPDGGSLHLVGHDWGSIQGWHFVCEPSLAPLIASYTSISGPHLDAVGRFFRRRSTPAPTTRAIMSQAARSWYVAAFQLPLLAPAFWRSRIPRRTWPRVLERVEGISGDRLPDAQRVARTQLDGAHGIGLYRANMLRSVGFPKHCRTDVPVQVIVPLNDRYVSTELAGVALDVADEVVFADVDAGHWLPLTDPDRVAALVAEHIERSERPRERPVGAAHARSDRGST